MYYKVKALAAAGIKIVLHYFDYHDRDISPLTPYCIEINAYKRKSILQCRSLALPYIICSRINERLITRLNEDEFPVLLEGLHCAGVLPYLQKQSRVKLRMHNDEAVYYHSLAALEKNSLKKRYFSLEAKRLQQFQSRMQKDIGIFCLAETDMHILQQKHQFKALHFVPCFIPWQQVSGQTGKGNYCLYHGNLAVSENEAAALWLIKNVFSQTKIPFVIAGNGISAELRSVAKNQKHIKLLNNLPVDELNGVIRDAHINILPSVNNTGVKLKLLHAVLEGRFCITNDNGINGSGISGVHVANTPEAYIRLVEDLYKQDFTSDHIAERKPVEVLYNNKANAEKLIRLL